MTRQEIRYHARQIAILRGWRPPPETTRRQKRPSPVNSEKQAAWNFRQARDAARLKHGYVIQVRR